ncbi:MAG TPA: glycoside hydrolase family 3 N-terminal domain-containing protein [Anaerolineaceae bacterium]|nr:glycoside hydrolase family 3 N-terminal domain-containing protein [Anaerolineaceae bacterium]
MQLRRFFSLWLVLTILLGVLVSPVDALNTSSRPSAQAIVDSMSPSEKVGQLFVVSFDGAKASLGSDINMLIRQHIVGGVILRPENDNFVSGETLNQAKELITSLQRAAWQSTLANDPANPPEQLPQYVPLFIGMEQANLEDAGGYALDGLSLQPSPLALGATWSTDLAKQAGEVLGSELHAIGVNFIVGPNLDVIESDQSQVAAIAGTKSFGGNPYWVGEMGKAFIEGLHTGSEDKLAVFAGHFPGLGAADRSPQIEISSVQKSFEQLQTTDLVPYLALTMGAESSQPEGFQVSHIRYNGFQGNLQPSSKPISFDSTSLEQLMGLAGIREWRQFGGLTMSDSLGSQAVRSFFASTGQTFDILTVARTSFLAGNDLLFLDDFRSSIDTSAYEGILRTHQFFVQKYNEDKFFAQKVDAAVVKIVAAKLKLFREFSLENAFPPDQNLNLVGKNNQVTSEVALRAASLISPGLTDLKTALPSAPNLADRIVTITDTRQFSLCQTCLSRTVLDSKGLQDALLRYYGPQGTKQLTVGQISAYSSSELLAYLQGNAALADQTLQDSLARATWVVFNLQNSMEGKPETSILQRVLATRPELLMNKKVVVFAYREPYYLDSTEISKISAYYALLGNSQPFVDAAARILMQELSPRGALPVSLSAVGYNLKIQTTADSRQVIPVNLVVPNRPDSTPVVVTQTAVTQEAPQPLFRTGELVKIQAGPLHDLNANQVPDGTEVDFKVMLAPENFIIAQIQGFTRGGLATVEYRIEREGIFEITASSGDAISSNTLVLNTEGGLAQVIMPTATPTLQPTVTPAPTPTDFPTPQTTAVATPSASANTTGYPRMGDWLLVIMILILGAGMAYLIGYYWWGSSTWGVRSMLTSFVGGLIAYVILTIGLTPLVALVKEEGSWFITQVAVGGLFFGWLVALLWWFQATKKARKNISS